MTQTLDEYFMGVYEMASDELDKSEQNFKEYPQSAENIVFHMESHRNAIGIIDFCYKKDFVHGKKNFYGATLCREWFYEEFSKGRYEVSAYDSVALAMIARDRGIQVTVEHNLLPEEYFVEANINYDEITMF